MIRRQMPRATDAAFLTQLFLTSVAGASAPIFGGPTYDASIGSGYQFPGLSYTAANGIAVAYVKKFDAGVDLGYRAVRWDASGAVELGGLSSSAETVPYGINSAGV